MRIFTPPPPSPSWAGATGLKAACALLAPLALALAAALLAPPADDARAHDQHSGSYPLHDAAGAGDDLAAVVHLLAAPHNIDVNAKASGGCCYYGGTALHEAAYAGRPVIAATLLAAGADPDATDEDGNAPLHWTVVEEGLDNASVASVLISANANVDAKNGLGETPLHLAAFWDDYAVVASLLVSAGADPDAQTDKGQTPLHRAVFTDEAHASVVAVLISAGADANLKDDAGDAPLHIAARNDDVFPLAAPLLDAGASVNATNSVGDTPLAAACRPACATSDAGFIALLIAAGGHWGESCEGAAEANPAGPSPPCVCRPPNVEAGGACEAAASCDAPAVLDAAANRCDCPPPHIGTDGAESPGDCLGLDTEANCRALGGHVQVHEATGARICSEVDWNDTFCFVGSSDAFPCYGLLLHVRRCNDDYNRPALDPWHCARACAAGRARGDSCD